MQKCGQTSSVVWCRDLGNNDRTRSTIISELRILGWMCSLARRDKIRNEHIRWTRVMKASTKITEKRLKSYGHVRRMKVEHIVRRILDASTYQMNIIRGRPNLRWKIRVREILQRLIKKRTTQQTGQNGGGENQLYRRPQMTGQAREGEGDIYKHMCMNNVGLRPSI